MLYLLLCIACLGRAYGLDPSIVTLQDVEYAMDGTVVQYSFHFRHDNVTSATVVPIFMDETCKEDISDSLGIILEPISIFPNGTMLGRASVDLKMAGDEIWAPPASGEPEGLVRFCYGIDVYRTSGTNQVLLMNALRTKFNTRVNFVVSFGGGRGDESVPENPSTMDARNEQVSPKVEAIVCERNDDSVAVCVESNHPAWTIKELFEMFVRHEASDNDLRIHSVDCGMEGQCRVSVLGTMNYVAADIVIGGTAVMVEADKETGTAALQEEFMFAIALSNSKFSASSSAHFVQERFGIFTTATALMIACFSF